MCPKLVSQFEFTSLLCLASADHCEMLNSCGEDEPMLGGEECVDAATDESLLETNPIQSPLQVFAGMGGLALIAERLPMLYPDVIQQVTHFLYDLLLFLVKTSQTLEKKSDCLAVFLYFPVKSAEVLTKANGFTGQRPGGALHHTGEAKGQ